MPSAEVIATISLAFNFLVAAIGLTWGISKVRDAVRDEIEEYKALLDNRIDALRSQAGEMGASLRIKITEVELFSRDNFVRRDTFNNFISSFSDSFKVQFDKMDRRLERMETKIDTVRTFQDDHPH